MTVSVSVELQGVSTLRKALSLLSRRMGDQTEQVTEESAQTILDIAKESMTGPKSGKLYGDHQASAPGEAPAIDTRDLYNSGKLQSQNTRTRYTYFVVFDSEHAKHMEFGTRHIEPRPYLAPAYALANARIKQAYVRAGNGAIRAS